MFVKCREQGKQSSSSDNKKKLNIWNYEKKNEKLTTPRNKFYRPQKPRVIDHSFSGFTKNESYLFVAKSTYKKWTGTDFASFNVEKHAILRHFFVERTE